MSIKTYYPPQTSEVLTAPVPLKLKEESERMPKETTRFSTGHTLPRDSGIRKEYPIYDGVVRYFPAAMAAVARLSKHGNDKHNPGEPLHHARGKSMDHANCIMRHLIDMEENPYDENGIPEVAAVAWRALALCQQWLEENEGAPMAPGAKE